MLQQLYSRSAIVYDSATGNYALRDSPEQIWADYVGLSKLLWHGHIDANLERRKARLGDAAIIADKIAADRGENFHAALADYGTHQSLAELIAINPGLGTSFKLSAICSLSQTWSWLISEAFVATKLPELKGIEPKVLGYADQLFRTDQGKAIIVDWKTKANRKSFSPGYHCTNRHKTQLAMYAIMAYSTYGLEVARCAMVYLFESGEPGETIWLELVDIGRLYHWFRVQAYDAYPAVLANKLTHVRQSISDKL